MKQKQHVVEKETDPLFSKTDTGQKLWYFLAGIRILWFEMLWF